MLKTFNLCCLHLFELHILNKQIYDYKILMLGGINYIYIFKCVINSFFNQLTAIIYAVIVICSIVCVCVCVCVLWDFGYSRKSTYSIWCANMQFEI